MMYWVLRLLPSRVRHHISSRRPLWLLPHQVILKTLKPDWNAEYMNEKETYKKAAPLQGFAIPIYYGDVLYDNKPGILLSDCGSPLSERQDIREEDLRIKLKEGLTRLEDHGIGHDDLTLSNILLERRGIWFLSWTKL